MSEYTGLTPFEGLRLLCEKQWDAISSTMDYGECPNGYDAFHTYAAFRSARLTAPYYTMHPQAKPATNSYIRGLPGGAAMLQRRNY